MKSAFLPLAAMFAMLVAATASVRIDKEVFGQTLGGWNNRSKQAAEYELSGATYRTYKPEVSTTPNGGIFVSVRIDHVRGWLSNDDHATLELTISENGIIVSAQSNIAIQGHTISSDLIRGGNDASHQAVAMDRAVQIGTDLVADLSAKLLREKIVEAGRVSFPAAVRHNYNKLFQSIRVEKTPVATVVPSEEPVEAPGAPDKPQEPPVKQPVSAGPDNSPVEIKPYATPGQSAIETKE